MRGGEDGGAGDPGALSGANRGRVQGRALADGSSVGVGFGGHGDGGGDRHAVFDHCDRDRPVGLSVQISASAINRVDDEGARGAQACRVVVGFFAEPAVGRAGVAQVVFQRGVDRQIAFGDRTSAFVLVPDLRVGFPMAEGDGASLRNSLQQQRKIV